MALGGRLSLGGRYRRVFRPTTRHDGASGPEVCCPFFLAFLSLAKGYSVHPSIPPSSLYAFTFSLFPWPAAYPYFFRHPQSTRAASCTAQTFHRLSQVFRPAQGQQPNAGPGKICALSLSTVVFWGYFLFSAFRGLHDCRIDYCTPSHLSFFLTRPRREFQLSL
ncbi:hypothetical protein DFH06DRAFT_615353 [Mycena polygramma]|nr:hypothetical protein DFH06DRAFT_615353 [Mycena polygramma]